MSQSTKYIAVQSLHLIWYSILDKRKLEFFKPKKKPSVLRFFWEIFLLFIWFDFKTSSIEISLAPNDLRLLRHKHTCTVKAQWLHSRWSNIREKTKREMTELPFPASVSIHHKVISALFLFQEPVLILAKQNRATHWLLPHTWRLPHWSGIFLKMVETKIRTVSQMLLFAVKFGHRFS